MRTAPRTDRGAVSFVEKAILGGAPPLFRAFLCLLRVAAGVPPILRICSRAARTSLSAIPCPRREGSTKVWSMV